MGESPQRAMPRASEDDSGSVDTGAIDAGTVTASRHSGGGTRELAELLRAASAGDRAAFDAAFSEVYDELHALASRVRPGSASSTLSATAIVHEAYLKLVPSADRPWVDRAHFFAVAARVMRQVLIDAARQRLASKRAGVTVALEEAASVAPLQPAELLALDEALDRLAQLSERQARVVELRFFAGLTAEEIARTLGIAPPTVQRDWRAARAWLARALGAPPPHDAPATP
jgi:RNA polymerase sigma factor (TIGR02999 family)